MGEGMGGCYNRRRYRLSQDSRGRRTFAYSGWIVVGCNSGNRNEMCRAEQILKSCLAAQSLSSTPPQGRKP